MKLLAPTFITFLRGFKNFDRRLLIILLLGALLVSAAIYLGLFYFLDYVSRAPILGVMGPVIGGLLVYKLLEMIYLGLFIMLFLSSVIASFSTLYLNNELELLMASPVSTVRIFWSGFIKMVIESSWMAIIFFIPIFYAFASARNAVWWAYFVFPLFIFLFILVPNICGGAFALILATFFPIRQTRKVFQFLSMLVLTGLIFFFRFLEPEKLINPSYFIDVSKYILALQTPSFEFLPSSGLREASFLLFSGNLSEALLKLGPLFGYLFGGIIFLHLFGFLFYRQSWQQSLEALENQFMGLEWVRRMVIFPFRLVSRDFRVVAEKEITNFIRDPALFSQIFMIGAIILVYFFNLKVMPLKDIPSLYSGEINDSMVYFNGPFIGFILSAMCMRFVYPSISLEGRAFWAVKASPMNPSRLIMIKFLLYLWPTLIVGLILCCVSNHVFSVTKPIIMWVSFLNVFLMGVVITALAVGVGGVYSRFDIDNPLKISGSFGGFVFMILCAIYILNILFFEAYPAWRFYFFRFYPYLRTRDKVLIIFSFVGLLVSTVLWTIIPLLKGMKKIKLYEPE